MLIINEPLTHVGLGLVERIRLNALTHTGLPRADQVPMATNRLAVAADMMGDGRDRPPPRPQRVISTSSGVSIETGLLSPAGVVSSPASPGGPHPYGWMLRSGERQ